MQELRKDDDIGIGKNPVSKEFLNFSLLFPCLPWFLLFTPNLCPPVKSVDRLLDPGPS